jgi:hypothetical protein
MDLNLLPSARIFIFSYAFDIHTYCMFLVAASGSTSNFSLDFSPKFGIIPTLYLVECRVYHQSLRDAYRSVYLAPAFGGQGKSSGQQAKPNNR